MATRPTPLLLAALLLPAAASADTMRCGSQLISEGDSIDKVLTLEGEDEIDAFFEDLVAPHFASYLLGGILGEDDAIKNWNEHKAFNIVLEEFVFGVGPTKEAATMQWSEAMEINGDDDGWED